MATVDELRRKAKKDAEEILIKFQAHQAKKAEQALKPANAPEQKGIIGQIQDLEGKRAAEYLKSRGDAQTLYEIAMKHMSGFDPTNKPSKPKMPDEVIPPQEQKTSSSGEQFIYSTGTWFGPDPLDDITETDGISDSLLLELSHEALVDFVDNQYAGNEEEHESLLNRLMDRKSILEANLEKTEKEPEKLVYAKMNTIVAKFPTLKRTGDSLTYTRMLMDLGYTIPPKLDTVKSMRVIGRQLEIVYEDQDDAIDGSGHGVLDSRYIERKPNPVVPAKPGRRQARNPAKTYGTTGYTGPTGVAGISGTATVSDSSSAQF